MRYGTEVIIDLKSCDVAYFTREHITNYFINLCQLLNLERGALHFWDDVGVPVEERQTQPHTVGTSAIQFILTSDIRIHTLDLLAEVYVNIFSCDSFNEQEAALFTRSFFQGEFQVGRAGFEWRVFERGPESIR